MRYALLVQVVINNLMLSIFLEKKRKKTVIIPAFRHLKQKKMRLL